MSSQWGSQSLCCFLKIIFCIKILTHTYKNQCLSLTNNYLYVNEGCYQNDKLRAMDFSVFTF